MLDYSGLLTFSDIEPIHFVRKFVPYCLYRCMKTEQNIIPTVSLDDGVVLKTIAQQEQVAKYLQPHRMKLGCLWIITRGNARLSINLSEYAITPNDMVMILPNSIIQIGKVTDDFACEIIAFSPDYVQDVDLVRQIVSNMETISANPVVALSSDEGIFVTELYSTFSRIYHRSRLQPSTNHGLLKNLLMSFFYGVCSIYDNHRMMGKEIELSRKEQIVRDYISLVFKHYDKERSVGWYASKLSITPTYLNVAVKDVRGVPASKIISDAVILYAKSKLKSSSDTVQQISDSLNFPNASFFAKFFKRETGLSPTEYRERNI